MVPPTSLAVAASSLSDLIARNAEVPILLLLSGGSALSFLDAVDTTACDKRITIGLVDERFGVDTSSQNFTQLIETAFYARVVTQGVQIIDRQVFLRPSLAEATAAYEKTIQAWIDTNKDGVVIVTLGMGADGHTAGIFAGFPELFTTTQLVVGYELPAGQNPYLSRITVTPYFLTQKVTAAVVYIAGADKQAMFLEAMSPSGDEQDLPARLWQRMKGLEIITSFN